MSFENVRKALFTAVKSTLEAHDFQGKIQWENEDFDPTKMAKWAAVHFIPAQPFPATLGTGGSDRLTGFIQVDIHVPRGGGFRPIYKMADFFRANFFAGKKLEESGTVVVILSCGLNQGSVVDNWYQRSATIFFRSDLPRT